MSQSVEAQRSLRSFIDGADHRGINGWAYFPNKPDVRVQLHLFIDGKYISTSVADQFRQDLVEAGVGDGQNSFTIALPESAEDGREHVIRIVDARNGGSDLPGSPFRLSPCVGLVQKVEDGIVTG